MKLGVSVILIVFVFLLSLQIHIAHSFEVSLKIIKNAVKPQETAEFDVIIQNDNESKAFIIYTQSMTPGWFSQDKYSVNLGPMERGVVKIYGTPPKDAVEGNKGFIVYVYSRSKPEDIKRLESFITVIRKERLILNLFSDKYRPSPGEKVSLKAEVKNVGSKDLGGVYLVFKVLGAEERRILPILESGVTYTFTKEIEIPENLAGEIKALVEILDFNDNVLKSNEIALDIAKVEKVKVSREVKKKFLVKTYIIKVKNEGNIPVDKEVVGNITKFERWFITFDKKPKEISESENRVFYVWKFENVSPGEERILEYSVDYRTLFIAGVILLAILIYLRFALAGPKIIKSARRYKKEHTIYLYVRNSTARTLKKVKLIDRVPNIAKVTGFEGVAAEVSRRGEDYELIWDIGVLKPAEERIFIYKLKRKIGVEGHVKFPYGKLIYFDRNKEYIKKSNAVHLDFS